MTEKMPDWKIYERFYVSGKPSGNPFLTGAVKARTKASALKKARTRVARWNRAKVRGTSKVKSKVEFVKKV